jgi:hypothetical protein
VGDRPAERSGPGPFHVDVDPLVVAGGVGEALHLLLGYLVPLAVAEVISDALFDPVDTVDLGNHGRRLRQPAALYRNQVRR